MAAAYFAEQGWEVYWSPNNNGPADFLITRGAVTQRVQVKTASLWTKGLKVYTRAKLCKSNGDLYETDDYDILAAVAADGRMWIIPHDKLPRTKALYLHMDDGFTTNDYEWAPYKVETDASS